MKIPQDTIEVPDYLIQELGYDKWVEFCKLFGGQRWWIPVTPSTIERDSQIKRLYIELMKTPGTKQKIILNKLSIKFNLSIKTIRRMVS